MSKKYTLNYFDFRGRAEPLRLALAYSGVEWEDHGVNRDEWKRLKPDSPFGNLPIFIEHRADGDRVLTQTVPIIRHLARLHGFDGKTEDERFAADAATELAVDLRSAWRTFRSDKDWDQPAKKQKYMEETAAPHFGRLEKMLGAREWYAADAPTYADFYIFDALDRHVVAWPEALKAQPRLVAFMGRVAALPAIAAYLAQRRPA
jgi:glutathione S-transferase